MKRLLVGFCLLILLAACNPFANAPKPWIYAETPVPPPDQRAGKPLVITVGDSIAAGWGECRAKPCGGIEFDWWQDALGNSAIVLSRGIGNSTSADLLERWEQDTQEAEIIIILIGVNDVNQAQSAGAILENFETMQRRATQAGQIAIFCTVPPSDTTDTPEELAVWNAVNAGLRTRAAEQGWRVIDLAALDDPANPGKLRRDTVAFEGSAHPNENGYAQLAEIMRVWWAGNYP